MKTEQLFLPLSDTHRHHNSPTLLAYYEAKWDFEEYLDANFDDVDFESCVEDKVWLEDMCLTIGVPIDFDSEKASQVKRNQLELWTARYREAVKVPEETHATSLLYYVGEMSLERGGAS